MNEPLNMTQNKFLVTTYRPFSVSVIISRWTYFKELSASF